MQQTFQRQYNTKISGLKREIEGQLKLEAEQYFNKPVKLVNLHEDKNDATDIALVTAIYSPEDEQ